MDQIRRMRARSSDDLFFSLGPPIGLILLTVGLLGCTGSTTASKFVDPAKIGARFHSSPAKSTSHPDSARDVRLSDDRTKISMDASGESILLKWTAGLRYRETPSTEHRPFLSIRGGPGQTADLGKRPDLGGPQRANLNPFAVLWSKDVALARVRSEQNFTSLPSDTARARIDRRLKAYQDTLRIDLYQFFQEDGFVDDLRHTKARLVDGENHTYPLVDRRTVSGRTTIRGETVYYGRTSFFFGRNEQFRRASQLLLNTTNLLTGDIGEDPRRFEWTWTSK